MPLSWLSESHQPERSARVGPETVPTFVLLRTPARLEPIRGGGTSLETEDGLAWGDPGRRHLNWDRGPLTLRQFGLTAPSCGRGWFGLRQFGLTASPLGQRMVQHGAVAVELGQRMVCFGRAFLGAWGRSPHISYEVNL